MGPEIFTEETLFQAKRGRCRYALLPTIIPLQGKKRERKNIDSRDYHDIKKGDIDEENSRYNKELHSHI